MESRFACCSGGHGQIANPDIDGDDVHELCGGWRGEIDGQGYEQIELLLWPVIPQFCIPDGGSLPNECDVLFVALGGNTDPSVQRPDTDLAIPLKGVIPLIRVLHSGRTLLGLLVRTLKAFLCPLFAALLG